VSNSHGTTRARVPSLEDSGRAFQSTVSVSAAETPAKIMTVFVPG